LRIIVTGASGQVGSELPAFLDGHDLHLLGRDELDVTDGDAVHAAVSGIGPDVILNCAAWNAVDAAESDPEGAAAVNALAPGTLADAATAAGAHLVHISTDYVFPGDDRTEPYVETDEPAPRSVYGRTKLEGERAVATRAAGHTVVRTAWVFGRVGRSLVEYVLRQAWAGEPLRMVGDQTGSPTSARDLAAAIARMGVERVPGLYHVVNAGSATPCQLAREVLELAGIDPGVVQEITIEQLGRPAPRPRYSVLGSERLPALRPYHEALVEMVPEVMA
jgi:dTDP-4-dehydrorhamnose reductase